MRDTFGDGDDRDDGADPAIGAPPDPPRPATLSAEVLFQTEVCCIGAMRCGASDPLFARPDPILRHVFVFPTVPVWVDRSGEESFLADPNLVTFHAEGDEIRRRALDARGDRCNWFALEHDHLMPRVEARRPRTLDRGLGPFGLRYGPSTRDTFLRQSILIDHLHKQAEPDALQVEEAVLDLADEVFQAAYRRPVETKTTAATRLRHQKLADDLKSWLGEHYRESATLEELASAVSSSPFHVHRVFRAQTGSTLHEYRNQLRLRTGLAAILDGEDNLTSLALSLGFASHSHFTDAFRKSFGVPPSKLRGDPWSQVRRF